MAAYLSPQQPTPDAHPCMSCRAWGPDCDECCPALDAWREAQAKKKREERDGRK